MVFSTILGFVSNIFAPAAKLIDDITTSDEERLHLRNELAKIKFEMQGKLLEYEVKLLESRASIVKAEAESSNILTSSWRPLVMLTFTGLIVARWFGLIDPSAIPGDLELELFSIIKFGLTGYIVGRSVEKGAASIPKAVKSLKNLKK